MNSRTLFITFSLLAVISVVSAALGGRRGSTVGGYSTIKDLTGHVQDIAKYAVTEHNKKTGSKLVYDKVVKGESQVVAGTNYRLVISAKDGSKVGDYEAVVYEKPWEHLMSLTSFEALH